MSSSEEDKNGSIDYNDDELIIGKREMPNRVTRGKR